MADADPSRLSSWRLSLLMAAIFIGSRLALARGGVEFDASTLPIAWQFLDPTWLREDLLRSVWFQHSQPPLFNLFLGGVLKLAPVHATAVFHLAFAGVGLAIYAAIYRLLHRHGLAKGWAIFWASVFILGPGAILYEHWLFYTWPVAGLLIVAGDALSRYEAEGSLRDAGFFLLALVAVCWLRSAFHLVFLLVAVGLLWCVPRHGARRRLRWMSVAAIALVGLVFVKNLVLFGTFASSSWMGMSLWRIAGQGHPEVSAMVATGALPEIAAIDAFSPVGDYPERYRSPEPSTGHVAALRDEKKTYGRHVGDGFDNLNHSAYIELSRDYQRAAQTMIRHDPAGYLGRVVLAWGTYCKPSWEYDFVAHNRPVLQRYIDTVTLAGPRFAIETAMLGRQPAYVFPLSSLIVIPLAFGLVMLAALGHLRRVVSGEWRQGDAFLLFAAVTIAYVAITGNALELGENHRFRVVTDPLLYVAVIVIAQRWRQPPVKRSRSTAA